MYKKLAFSLIELMVCLGILMILSTIAYPIYEGQIARAYRQNAQVQLLKLAQDLEIFHAENHSYQGFRQTLINQNYEINISEASEDQYLLQAIPKTSQAKRDKNCGALSLDNTGKREIGGQGNSNQCWNIS